MTLKEFYDVLCKQGLQVSIPQFEQRVAYEADLKSVPDGDFEIPGDLQEKLRAHFGVTETGAVSYSDPTAARNRRRPSRPKDTGALEGPETEAEAQVLPQPTEQPSVTEHLPQAPPHPMAADTNPVSIKSWEEVKAESLRKDAATFLDRVLLRNRSGKDSYIGVLGTLASGKSAYFYVVGTELINRVRVGKWMCGLMSNEFGRFLEDVRKRLPRWEKTRLDNSVDFHLFTLVHLPWLFTLRQFPRSLRGILSPYLRKTVHFDSFDCSGEAWRIAFSPGAESQVHTPLVANVVSKVREMASLCSGFIVIIDAALANPKSEEEAKQRSSEELLWNHVFGRLAWLDGGDDEDSTTITRPVSIVLNKADLYGAQFAIEDLLHDLTSLDGGRQNSARQALDSPAKKTELSRRARQFIRDHFPHLYDQIEERCELKHYSLMSCWGRNVESKIVPDDKGVETEITIIPEPHRAFGIGEPLLWVVDRIHARRERRRIVGHTWRTALATASVCLVMIIALLATATGAKFAARTGNPVLAETLLSGSNWNPISWLLTGIGIGSHSSDYLDARKAIANAYWALHEDCKSQGAIPDAITRLRDAQRVIKDNPAYSQDWQLYAENIVKCQMAMAEASSNQGDLQVSINDYCQAVAFAREFKANEDPIFSDLSTVLLARYEQDLAGSECAAVRGLYSRERDVLTELGAGETCLTAFDAACLDKYENAVYAACKNQDCERADCLAGELETAPFCAAKGRAETENAHLYAELVNAWLSKGIDLRAAGRTTESDRCLITAIERGRAHAVDCSSAVRGLLNAFLQDMSDLGASGDKEALLKRNCEIEACIAKLAFPDELVRLYRGHFACASGRILLSKGQYEEALTSYHNAASLLPADTVSREASPALLAAAEARSIETEFDIWNKLMLAVYEFAAQDRGEEVRRLHINGVLRSSENLLRKGRAGEALGRIAAAIAMEPSNKQAIALKRHAEKASSMIFVNTGKDGFYCDSSEVSTAAFLDFLRESPASAQNPQGLSYGDYELYSPDRSGPVVFVSHLAAEAYARHTGKRLPTREEWQAAVGSSAYPWGDGAPECCVNTRERQSGRAFQPDSELCRRDVTPTGIRNLAGNVAEWTATQSAGGYLVAGGSYLTPLSEATRDHVFELASDINLRDIGFRCVMDCVPAD